MPAPDELLSWEAANMLWRMGTPLEFRWKDGTHWIPLIAYQPSATWTTIHDKPDMLDLRVKQ